MERGYAIMIQRKENGYKEFFKRFARPYIPTIALLLALQSIGMLFSLVSPLLMKYLVDDVFINKKIEVFGYILAGITGIYALSSISNYFSTYFAGKLNLGLFKDVAKETFSVFQFASLKKSQEMRIGDVLSRIRADVNSAIQVFASILPQFIISTISIIAPFIIMLFLNYQLTLIALVPIFFFILSSSFFGKRIKQRQRISLDKIASVQSFSKEALSSIPLIKVFGLEKWSREKFDNEMNEYYNASMNVTKTSSLSLMVSSFIYGFPMILLFSFGGLMLIQGSLTLGTLTAFMGYVGTLFSPISTLSRLWTGYKRSSAAFDRVYEIFELEKESDGDAELIIKEGKIDFENVWFSYDKKPVLQGFSAEFNKGLNYIIGSNGAGKTTILKLLCGLYPYKGKIAIDGQDLSKVKKESLRKNISIVFSEPYLFDQSIYGNIHIGDLSASDEVAIRAAKSAKIHNFITSLPKKYETTIGEAGSKLSSGEKQRITLARAILKNPPILLLDEATKSIDVESRKSIYETIKNLKEKTIIIITQNMNEIEKGSNIIYLRNGKRELGINN